MGRYLAGAAMMLALAAAAVFAWRAQADRPEVTIPPAPVAAPAAAPLRPVDLAPPPVASERSREERRFARYDRDKSGNIGRTEYLFSRQRAFARLDADGDGRVSFEEYAIKASAKFAAADRNRDGSLGPAEFATTRTVRKARPRPACPPVMQRAPVEPDPEES